MLKRNQLQQMWPDLGTAGHAPQTAQTCLTAGHRGHLQRPQHCPACVSCSACPPASNFSPQHPAACQAPLPRVPGAVPLTVLLCCPKLLCAHNFCPFPSLLLLSFNSMSLQRCPSIENSRETPLGKPSPLEEKHWPPLLPIYPHLLLFNPCIPSVCTTPIPTGQASRQAQRTNPAPGVSFV